MIIKINQSLQQVLKQRKVKKINEEMEKLESIIDKNDIKVFSKYEDLNKVKLKKLLGENTEYYKVKHSEKSKNNLSDLLNQFNKTIINNYDILYKEKLDPEFKKKNLMYQIK